MGALVGKEASGQRVASHAGALTMGNQRVEQDAPGVPLVSTRARAGKILVRRHPAGNVSVAASARLRIASSTRSERPSLTLGGDEVKDRFDHQLGGDCRQQQTGNACQQHDTAFPKESLQLD